MLKATDPNYDAKAVGLKAAQQEHISKNIAEHFKHRDEIYAYITGKAELDTILPFADEESCNGGHQNMNYVGESAAIRTCIIYHPNICFIPSSSVCG
jgi:hypothetical protein